MISYLRGKLKNKSNNYIIIDVRDVGYKVFVNNNVFADFGVGDNVDLYIYLHTNDQGSTLYGVASISELDFFELLVSVSGIGPKTALNVLEIAPMNEIKNSIANNNHELLNKVSGIGKKTAERVVLELKNKIDSIDSAGIAGKIDGSKSDEIDALIVLGYSESDARQALSRVDPGITDSSEKIKEALKKMG